MLKTVSSITNAIGALNYKGTWNASTNTPTLASGVGTKGDYYVVSVAGSTALDGISTWYVGDWVAFNGVAWQRLEGGVDDPAPSLRSNATTGLMQINGPAAGQTRAVTIPDANSVMARTDAPQTFTGQQTINQTSAGRAARITGNTNSENVSQKNTVVRFYQKVSLGTKLIIPFVNQGNLNCTTVCKIVGHNGAFNSNTPLGFEITFAVGHIDSLSNLASWGGFGNYSSIAINGMNVEVTFSSAYSSGVMVSIEYMTSVLSNSIDVANIAMN